MEIAERQLTLPLNMATQIEPEQSPERLAALLGDDLDFHDKSTE